MFKKHIFQNIGQSFLIFGPWMQTSSIFDLKFGFYEQKPPRNRLEMSRIQNLSPKRLKFIFSLDFVYYDHWLKLNT